MLQTGWLIYSKKDAKENASFINRFIKEAQDQNINLYLVLRENLKIGIIDNTHICHLNKQSIKLPDLAIIRTIEPLLNLHLETLGVKVFNSSMVSRICNNKALTHSMINRLNIPMVDTLFLHGKNLTKQAPMNFPFVLKDAESRGGAHVHLITGPTEWHENIARYSSKNLIIQSSNAQHGKDLRVFVVGKKIIGAVLRESSTDFRANYKLGGSATWYELTHIEKEIIYKIINHFDFGMVGIDFLIGLDGKLLFNEIEDVVGSRILSVVSNKNIINEYITHIKKYTLQTL